MRILILSCNTGEGHNSAAKAILQVFAQRQIEVSLCDALSFWSPKISKFISDWHVRIYKHMPGLFRAGYRTAERHDPSPEDTSAVYNLVSQGAERLYEELLKEHFDAVVSTHAFASLMMRRVQRDHPQCPPHYFVSTDYTCCPYAAEAQATCYLIPHKGLIPEFVECGVEESRIHVTGIPVRQEFFIPRDKNACREKLCIPKNAPMVLLACGSMGCGPIKKLTQLLSEQLPPEVLLVVVCGRNELLESEILELPSQANRRVLGFTTDMVDYMGAADLMVTKPGGLSSTEAAVLGLPSVYIDAVGGCETRNLNFFLGQNLAWSAPTVEALADLVCEKIQRPQELQRVSQGLKTHFSLNGAAEICDFVQKEASHCSNTTGISDSAN